MRKLLANRLALEVARSVVFFFQAEDGIRDYKVTGVQTCALPIWTEVAARRAGGRRLVVRPLGRQPPVRHRRGAPGARGLRRPIGPSRDAACRRVDRKSVV